MKTIFFRFWHAPESLEMISKIKLLILEMTGFKSYIDRPNIRGIKSMNNRSSRFKWESDKFYEHNGFNTL